MTVSLYSDMFYSKRGRLEHLTKCHCSQRSLYCVSGSHNKRPPAYLLFLESPRQPTSLDHVPFLMHDRRGRRRVPGPQQLKLKAPCGMWYFRGGLALISVSHCNEEMYITLRPAINYIDEFADLLKVLPTLNSDMY